MNFTQFSFWWVLLGMGFPILIIRLILTKLKLWPKEGDKIILAFVSLVVFFKAAQSSSIIFMIELIFNYVMVTIMLKSSGFKARGIAITTVFINIAILIYFKYFNFLVNDVILLIVPSFKSYNLFKNVLSSEIQGIPPGISFYTFQMVGFVIDSFRSKDKKSVGFVDYINFTSFFPQVVAGPIERRIDLLPQLENFSFRFHGENLEAGARWVILGMFMKLVLGDNLSSFINLEETQNVYLIGLSIYLFGLRIYFDFTGYSLIALGLAKVLGLKLTLNFLAPYTSTNIQEFWRRWHVTLSSWFRDYLYLPLGGSRVSWVNLNLLIVFGISGLWHGVGYNFIIWGLYHGILLIMYRYAGKYRLLPKPAAWLVTFTAVLFGWLFFMETNFPRLMLKLQAIVNPLSYSISNAKAAIDGFNDPEQISLSILLIITTVFLILEHFAVIKDYENPYKLLLSGWLSPLILIMLMLISSREAGYFVYFEF